jgi:ribosomal protein L3
VNNIDYTWGPLLTGLVLVAIILVSVLMSKVLKLKAEVYQLSVNIAKMNTAEENEARHRVDSVVNGLTWKLNHLVENAVSDELKRANIEMAKQELENRLAAAKEKNSIDTRGTTRS